MHCDFHIFHNHISGLFEFVNLRKNDNLRTMSLPDNPVLQFPTDNTIIFIADNGW